MAHWQVSNTEEAGTEYPRILYWLNPPCSLARCPISCQNSRKLSSPSLFLSSELMSCSMAVGSLAFCRKTGRYNIKCWKTIERVSKDQLWCYWLCVCVAMRHRQADTTGTYTSLIIHATSAEVVWHKGLRLCLHLVAKCDYFNCACRNTWNFPHLEKAALFYFFFVESQELLLSATVLWLNMQSADNTTTNGQDWSKTSKGGNDFLYDKLIVFVEHSET